MHSSRRPQVRAWPALRALAVLALLALPVAAVRSQPAQGGTLSIGTSGSLSGATSKAQETAALVTLQDFIHSETRMDDKIVQQKDWQQLAEKLKKGQVQIGVFQGYEFAWAQAMYPDLKPLALAVNVYTYPTAYVVTRKDGPARDFAGLQGQTLDVSAGPDRYVRLFVATEAEAQGKTADQFFSKVRSSATLETALDDLVDGKVQAVAASRAGLEAYKRRKPGRFAQLKPVARSQPFPPTVVAFYDGQLDTGTLDRFRDGLLHAGRTDRGQTLLTLFKLTEFELPPADLNQVLARTREQEPASLAAKLTP
jgi:ABC-type phosphate/phosphonate transport system substrate-binding protein